MQNIKDSFFITLRDRLAALNPQRVVTVLGTTRSALLVTENELATEGPPQANAFYISWSSSAAAKGTERLDLPLLELACQISYWTQGTDDLSSQDRGRALAQMDTELLSICNPTQAELMDHSQSPPADLSAIVFWTPPILQAIKTEGRKLSRVAALNIFCHAEVGLP